MKTLTHNTRRVLYTSDGKHSGCVLEDGMLKRKASARRHQLRYPPAWAFEENILREAERQGATLVQVVDTDTGCDLHGERLAVSGRTACGLNAGMGCSGHCP
jgi:hypothetical protein